MPNLCVSPAARNGSRAIPVAAILSLLLPSNSHEPSLSCMCASQTRPRATAASEMSLPPPAFKRAFLVAGPRPRNPGAMSLTWVRRERRVNASIEAGEAGRQRLRGNRIRLVVEAWRVFGHLGGHVDLGLSFCICDRIKVGVQAELVLDKVVLIVGRFF